MTATAQLRTAVGNSRSAGFTLIEMALAIFVIALLLGSLLVPLATQVEQRQIADTQKYLDDIREALIGFAIANGRLPCPASSTSLGVESPVGGGACTNNFDGFVPAATLGVAPVDNQGFAIDPWGNRIRFAVAAWNNVFTTANAMSATGLATLSASTNTYLLVCSTATGISGSGCAAGSALTSAPGVPAVIYSIGKNGGTSGTGIDEAANPNPKSANNDRVFVSHNAAPKEVPNGEFDDIVIWLSPQILYNRMVAAGRLP
jgi:prepilin-type N-terminal cleavage/methylation domain-containing protein